MGKPGIIAFPVILALGAITGYITYTSFTDATPDYGVIDSPYRKDLAAADPGETNSSTPVDESQFTNVVTINILEGSSIQGSPDFDPDAATAASDALVKWVNQDALPHTATSGKDGSDPESGQLFDSGFLNKGQEFSIPASEIGAGEHVYYCQVHPYMTSQITVQ